jgi:hypothetical protein
MLQKGKDIWAGIIRMNLIHPLNSMHADYFIFWSSNSKKVASCAVRKEI